MRRKFVRAMFFGTLALAVSGSFIGCKDYDDDIQVINERLASSEAAMNDVKTTLASGDWVKSVESTTNGIVINMGSGKSFNITNGVNGANGQDGAPGTVWTIVDGYWYKDGANTGQLAVPTIVIGENGNWIVNGVDSGVKAAGIDGKDGVDGTNGADGKDGVDGTNGTDGKDGVDGTNGADGKDGVDGTNGADGKDGVDGTNGTDGKDGVNGTNGADGKDGVDGTNGADGKDGVPGIDGTNGLTPFIGTNGNWWIGETDTNVKATPDCDYYTPGTDGYWYKNGEKTDQLWKDANTVTAVVDPITGYLMLYGVGGDNENPYVLSMNTAALRSLVFIPQGYVDGVPAIFISGLQYYTMMWNPTAKEFVAGTGSKYSPKQITASYHMNPTSAAEKGIDFENISFVAKNDIPFYSTRSISNLVAIYKDGHKDGKINVEMKGDFSKLASGTKIDVVALKVPVKKLQSTGIQDDATDGFVTSDYATVYKEKTITDLGISDKKPTLFYPKTLIDARAQTFYVKLVWNQTLDLLSVVNTAEGTATPGNIVPIADYNLDYVFELSDITNIGADGKTDQQQFIELNGSTVNTKVYSDPTGAASLGRLPIVRVKLIDKSNGDAVVRVAYIKIKIVEAEVPAMTVTKEVDKLPVTCGQTYERVLTAEQINREVYNVIGLSHKQFVERYDINGATVGIGTLITNDWANETVTTPFRWIITSDQIWSLINAGKASQAIEAKVIFKAKAGYEEFGDITIIMKTSIDTSNITGLNVPFDALYKDYWNADRTMNSINVKVPESPFALNTVFEAHIMSGFHEATIQKLFTDRSLSADLKFKFRSPQPYSIDGKQLTVSSDGLKLSYGLDGIAEIVDVASTDPKEAGWTVRFINSKTAQQLLNGGNLKAAIMMSADLCGSSANSIAVTVNNQVSYDAKFIRPVDVENISKAIFYDRQTDGSTVTAAEMLSLSDWRPELFKNNPGLYDWYGIQGFTMNTEAATHTLYSDPNELVKNTKIQLTPNDNGTKTVSVTYKNNGQTVQSEFTITIPVTTVYYWGEYTQKVTVTVKPTVKPV